MKSVKRAIWLIFGLFSGPLFSPKQFLKKSYKRTFLAISILFRGNLWKIPQQFGENLEKKMRFWANLGCSWSPWEPRLVIVCCFFCWKFHTITHCKSLYCFEGCFSKNTKNSSEKRGKMAFWAQFWAIFYYFA